MVFLVVVGSVKEEFVGEEERDFMNETSSSLTCCVVNGSECLVRLLFGKARVR